MAWEHECGSIIYDDAERAPVAGDCSFCRFDRHGKGARVKKTWEGWRWVPADPLARSRHLDAVRERHEAEHHFRSKREAKQERQAQRKEAAKRSKISRGKRSRIYRRDRYTCVSCGVKPRKKDRAKVLTLDHKIPVSKGGSNRDENLDTMCAPCNRAKGNTLPEDGVNLLALR